MYFEQHLAHNYINIKYCYYHCISDEVQRVMATNWGIGFSGSRASPFSLLLTPADGALKFAWLWAVP